MILLGIGVLIVLAALSWQLYWSKDVEIAEGVCIISVIFLFIGMVAAVFLTITVANLSVIDDRIAMYQEENAKIEQQIADIVFSVDELHGLASDYFFIPVRVEDER